MTIKKLKMGFYPGTGNQPTNSLVGFKLTLVVLEKQIETYDWMLVLAKGV